MYRLNGNIWCSALFFELILKNKDGQAFIFKENLAKFENGN